ncbi:MAG: YebC/PmpR family DNA-binding transcriptional regulator, partial [Alphaproteobacteria bacterium]|nr:YebC/PmpR family DNA-binding transcriptional regulator [Alphaproteobacteria bacterium]
VEALTDNRNRTAGDVRSAFTKSGGALGESNSVAFGFQRLGRIRYPAAIGTEESVLEAALEAGADDLNLVDDHFEIDCGFTELFAIRDALAARFGEPESAALAWSPSTTILVDDSQAEKLLRLIENLEDFDDVQSVWGNYQFSDGFLTAMAE